MWKCCGNAVKKYLDNDNAISISGLSDAYIIMMRQRH
jgi:hypothetical protein